MNRYALSEHVFHADHGVYRLPAHVAGFRYSDGPEIERYICEAIKSARDLSDNSEELMHAARDWPSLYHLGMGRSNVMKALGIRDANILEIGSGCGAITRFLAETNRTVDAVEGSLVRARTTALRCRDLKNVRVYCTNANDIAWTADYDFVTLIGVLEYASQYWPGSSDPRSKCLAFLRHVKQALKPDGKIVIAIENKMGLKYWSGCQEDHTGKIYDGIHDYPNGGPAVTFSRSGMDQLLAEAGWSSRWFSYCFPDYKFTSTILNGSHVGRNLYWHNWIDTPFASPGNRRYTYHEALAVKTVSEAGLIADMANSFLIVAGNDPRIERENNAWAAKKYSIKRRKPFRCVTTAKVDGGIRIHKEREYPTPREEISHGTVRLSHEIGDGKSEWHAGDLVAYEIAKAVMSDGAMAALSVLLRRHYDEMIRLFGTGAADEQGYPIVKGSALDFSFRNIIRSGDRFEQIDHEWIAPDGLSADYVVYRAVAYDFLDSQKPWVSRFVRNEDEFMIMMIRSIFDRYDRRRHAANKRKEADLLEIVMAKDALGSFRLRKALDRGLNITKRALKMIIGRARR